MSIEGSRNYVRQLYETKSLLPEVHKIAEAYHWLQEWLPDTTLPDGYRIPISELANDELIHFPDTGTILAAGNHTTSVTELHQVLSLGIDVYETPPKESELNAEERIPFIHERSYGVMSNEMLRQRILQRAYAYFLAEPKKFEVIAMYMERTGPVDLEWLINTVTDTLFTTNEMMGGKLLDQNGRINQDFQKKVYLFNAVSGAGGIMGHHDRSNGRGDEFTLMSTLENEATGIIASLYGIKKSNTVGGACAASVLAMNLAEELAASRKNTADIFIVMSAYPGPTKETRQAFDAADIHMSDRPPYLHNKKAGYTEAAAAVTNIFVTKKMALEFGLPLHKGRLIETVNVTGENAMGVGKDDIPEETYREGFEKLQRYYGKEYTGTIIFMTHGVNTYGWFTEIQALLKLKKEYYPYAHFVLTSTQSQMGHNYASRASISLEVGTKSIQEGILAGMVRANEDMSIPNQRYLQALRQEALRGIGLKIKPRVWDFEGNDRENMKSQQRIESLFPELADDKIHLCFGTMRIPLNVPLVITHNGLHAGSGLALSIPLRK